MNPTRIFAPSLCVGLVCTAGGFASVRFGPFFWSERLIAVGMLSVGVAFVANFAAGIGGKKMQDGVGDILTLQQRKRRIFRLNLILNLILASFAFVFAYLFWFVVRAT
jgi:hypothetical protein